MATITAVAALDSLDEGRVKINTNDTNLNAGLAATDAAMAVHVGTGVGSGHATYAAYEARIAALEAGSSTLNTLAIPFAFSGAGNVGATLGGVVQSGSIGMPLPAGTITCIKVTTMGGAVVSGACSIAVGNNSSLRLFDDGTGIIMAYKNGVTTNFGVNIGSDYAAFAIVYMTI